MSRSICWGARTRRFLRRCARGVRGSVAIEFAFILPLLLIFTIGVIEFGLILFDFHRASEATRRALRLALINPPLTTLSTISNASITCTKSGGNVSCTAGTVQGTAGASFDSMVQAMQGVLPTIQDLNVEVTYADSGLDAGLPPGLVTPLVTVRLTNLTRPFIVLNVFGLPASLTFPGFSTSAVGPTQ